ncbi:MAG: tetratricopeptide repeat protein [Austwickia sp.]|nr:tetratricopeptide repeat protein [Austwickia sp.]
MTDAMAGVLGRINQLPLDVDLIGRDNEIRQLQEIPIQTLFNRPTVSLLTGPPGVGKSAVAIRFAYSVAGRYPNAFYANFMDNSGNRATTATTQVISRFLDPLLGVSEHLPDDSEILTARWLQAMDTVNSVIVLDNIEDYDQIKSIIPHTSNCRIIATSRAPIPDLSRETMPIRPLDSSEAENLFLSIAIARKEARGSSELSKVVRACSGYPLAIRVLAAHVNDHESSTLADISQDVDSQSGLSAVFGVHGKTVAASFRVAYGGLSEMQATLFRRLGAVPGESIEVHMAQALMPEWEGAATKVLDELRNKQLVQATQSRRYYSMHAIASRFAAEQLTEVEGSGARMQILHTIISYYLTNLQRASRLISHDEDHGGGSGHPGSVGLLGDRTGALQWLENEKDNITSLVKQACRDGYTEEAWQLCCLVVDFFDIRAHWDHWRETHEEAIDALRRVDSVRGLAHTLRGLGRLHRARGDWEASIRSYRESAALFYRLADAKNLGITMLALGDDFRYVRRWNSAQNCLQKARELLQREHDDPDLAVALRSLGAIARHRGEYQDAEQLYREAIRIKESEKDRRWVAATKLSLADVLLDQNRVNEAEESLRECLNVFDSLRDRHWQALALRSLAEARRRKGHPEEALGLLSDSRAILIDLKDVSWDGQVHHAEALAYLQIGKAPEAFYHLTEALQKFKDTEDPLWEARTYVRMDKLRRAAPDLVLAEDESLGKAWTLLVEQGAAPDLLELNLYLDRHESGVNWPHGAG